MIECSVCHSKIELHTDGVSKAYDKRRTESFSKTRFLHVALVVGDCVLVGLQPVLVYVSKVDGGFKYSPISVNFLTEIVKFLFAVVMLLLQAKHKRVGEKSLLSFSTFVQAAQDNVLLAVPAFLYAINNYLKFIMQLYFNPATVKMLSNLKVFVIALLLKIIMKRQFSIIQWEALALLLIGVSVNQLRSLPEGTTALGIPLATGAYLCTLIFVTIPSLGSVYNEYALKSQFETSIYLQNLFLYGYGAIFNFLGIVVTVVFEGTSGLDILQGHSKATMLLICNNAAQGILSSFFFKYAGILSNGDTTILLGQGCHPTGGALQHSGAPVRKKKPFSSSVISLDTILKKYSSAVATIFTGLASAAMFGHSLTINFVLGISIVFISMHQFFSPLLKVKDEPQSGGLEMIDSQINQRSKDTSFINMAAGANEEASHHVGNEERTPLLPI
ncbi:hypothetical protein Patl1_23962 [Pistacia atlantica]|uniref:Uncharacterized protein n=1 Tax=Pistacia atlantica TaxID=434234 RepID=A0ACC1A1A6_9ROSI|nr:hypothetical protein Patl1_23962 [Pistacia atlantica]